jgi:hypothetical protein
MIAKKTVHYISPDTAIRKLTSTYATLMKDMHKCLSRTYTPVVNWFIDVHQLSWGCWVALYRSK